MLSVLWRVFSGSVLVFAKRSLYIYPFSILLFFCMTPIPLNGIQDVKCLEFVQPNPFVMTISWNCLLHLNLIPLMMEYEIAHIMLLVKFIKFPSDHFPICNFVKFYSHPTRAGHTFKLKHSLCRSKFEQSYYFNRIPCCLWNYLFFLDITLPFNNKIRTTTVFLGSFPV